MIRTVLILAAAAFISACGGLAPPMTEAQREAQRQREWESRYDKKAAEDCRQTPDIIERRACLDRVEESNRVMRDRLPLRS